MIIPDIEVASELNNITLCLFRTGFCVVGKRWVSSRAVIPIAALIILLVLSSVRVSAWDSLEILVFQVLGFPGKSSFLRKVKCC